MSAKLIRELERTIVKKTIEALLEQGFRMSVNHDSDFDDQAIAIKDASDATLDEMFACDEAKLEVFSDFTVGKTTHFGWINFVYGNDGWDVISDYSTSLEKVMRIILVTCGPSHPCRRVVGGKVRRASVGLVSRVFRGRF